MASKAPPFTPTGPHHRCTDHVPEEAQAKAKGHPAIPAPPDSSLPFKKPQCASTFNSKPYHTVKSTLGTRHRHGPFVCLFARSPNPLSDPSASALLGRIVRRGRRQDHHSPSDVTTLSLHGTPASQALQPSRHLPFVVADTPKGVTRQRRLCKQHSRRKRLVGESDARSIATTTQHPYSASLPPKPSTWRPS